MTEKQIKNLMKKYLEGKLSRGEELMLERFDSTLFNENLSKVTKPTSDDITDRNPINLNATLSSSKQRSTWYAIAAAVIILIGIGSVSFGTFWQQEENPVIAQIVKTADYGKRLTLKLSDGTKVYLNSGSTIEFPERFVGKNRVVHLDGEAFFEVAKDSTSPFVIQSNSLQTTVLGTSFNVNSYDENSQVKISVKSGKVRVNSDDDRVVLGPDQQAIFDKKTKNMRKATINSNHWFAWKDGILHFSDQPMSEVLKTLERWYGVDFKFDNHSLQDCHLTASFKNEPLGVVLESIVYTKKELKYQYLNDKEILIKGKCTD